MKIDPLTLDFALPDELIAQEPLRERDRAQLLVLNRASGAISHRTFADLPDYLRPTDTLVINKAKVSKAKLTGKKPTGGKVEAIFIEKEGGRIWKALVRPVLKEGTRFSLGKTEVEVKGRTETGEYRLDVAADDFESVLARDGKLPLPPYIKRSDDDPRDAIDETDYQTVFAAVAGSVAAPTAGLHFSESLLARIKASGVSVIEILLHVGWGTFRPIASSVSEHKMLPERFEIDRSSYDHLLAAKREQRRIVSVGTTSTRVLESLGEPPALAGATNLFIQPGFAFRWVDALVTNLHVPRSTPVALTAAFSGLENLERAYSEAIDKRYRFFSYGDAMLIH